MSRNAPSESRELELPPPDFVYRNFRNIPDQAKTATPVVETVDQPAE